MFICFNILLDQRLELYYSYRRRSWYERRELLEQNRTEQWLPNLSQIIHDKSTGVRFTKIFVHFIKSVFGFSKNHLDSKVVFQTLAQSTNHLLQRNDVTSCICICICNESAITRDSRDSPRILCACALRARFPHIQPSRLPRSCFRSVTLGYGYSFESTQRGLSNEYQNDKV